MFAINNIPRESEVSESNRSFLAHFNKRLGRAPNLLVVMMHSQNALSTYYSFNNRKTSLSKREIEAITLSVSQHNRAMYCLSAHTMIAKLNSFSDEEILKLRRGTAPFDSRLDALVRLAIHMAIHKKIVDNKLLDLFFAERYTKEHFMDMLQVIGDTFITNITGRVFQVPIDYPLAKEL